jgi:hypothetical protein
MKELLDFLPLVLYVSVGVICLVMAFKCLFSDKYLPFHEKAANKPWNEIEALLKLVILFFLRLSGLGFLVMSILLIVFPIVNYFIPSTFYKYSIPVIGLIFCTGLFVNNYLLYNKTKANTPWKGSLYAMAIILTGIIISIFFN